MSSKTDTFWHFSSRSHEKWTENSYPMRR